MQKTLFIYDASGASTGSVTSYADEQIHKTLNNDITFTFSVPFTTENKTLCTVGNKVRIDSDIFIISQIEDIKSQSEYYRKCTCDGLHYELLANLIKGSHSYTGIVALFTAAVAGSGWGVVLEGSYTVPNDLDMTAESTLVHVWDYENSLKIINDLCDKWKVEVAYTADVVSNQITNKKIHLYSKRGTTRTGQYTFSKNIESLKKTTDFTGIETRIIGVGAVLSSDGTNNTYRDFKDAVWATAAGKPVNKPAGQNYVEDAAAIALYGIRTGTYKLNTIDAAKLLTNSWRSLQARKQPVIGYEIAAGDLYSLIGDAAYTCEIGDTIPVYDADLGIDITARIMELEYNPNDATLTKVVLGNYRRLVDVDTIRDMQEDADATQSYVVGEIGKTNASITVQAGLISLRAEKTYVDTQLAGKASTAVTTSLQSQIDAQAGQITLKANKTVTDGLTTRMDAAELLLQPDNIRLAVGQIGGNNLIVNGKCDFGISGWGTSNATRALSNSTVLGRQVFRVVATAANGSMTQTVSGLIVGNWYTVSARVSKDTGATQARILLKRPDASGADVWTTAIVKETNGWEVIKSSFIATGPSGQSTWCSFYFNTVGEGFGSGWTDIKLEEGRNATIWTPNASELKSSSMSITNDTVAIDTQNFNLTLRDASNNPKLIIDGTSQGLVSKGLWGSNDAEMLLNNYTLTGKVNSKTTLYLNPTRLMFNDYWGSGGGDNSALALGTNTDSAYLNVYTGADHLMISATQPAIRIYHDNTIPSGKAKTNFYSDVGFENFRLINVDWTNKMQCGAVTSNATAGNLTTVTFPTAFPAGSVVRVSVIPRTSSPSVTVTTAAAATTTGFQFRCSAASTICEWIAIVQ